MQPMMTPSKVTAWLDCPHYLTLRDRVDNRLMTKPESVFGSFAQLLADKGLAHERDCLQKYRERGKSVLELEKHSEETFDDWVARVGNPFAENWDVVYQMPFIHDGIRGVADFVERVIDPETGAMSWEPVDAKLTRVDAKPGHVLQLCFYADAIFDLTGVWPRRMHLWLGSGDLQHLLTSDFHPYWRRLRRQLTIALAAGPLADTSPKPCRHCEFCEFSAVCEEQWRQEDSLTYVAGIREPDIAALNAAGVATLADLGRWQDRIEGMHPERLAKLVDQAALQVLARAARIPNCPSH